MTLSIPNDFVSGQTIVAGDMNANFTAVETYVNTSPGMVARDIVNSKGDVLVASANDVVTRQGVGTNGQVLSADSSTTTGLAWIAAPTDVTKMPLAGGTFTGPVTYQGASPILLTGATTGNGYEITLTVTDPTADRVITIPNAAGTMALVSDIPATVNGTADNIISNQVFS
jgi:hypothetical protein